MTAFDRMIEPVRQFAFARQCAKPFTFIIGDAADLPLRQFQIDQRQRSIGPGARLDQPLCPCDGKRRQALLMISDINPAVTAPASRSRSTSSAGF
jgi:hypothetical protein